jgi:hypothetical protein
MTAGGSGKSNDASTNLRGYRAIGLWSYRNIIGSQIDRSARLGVLKDQVSPDQS